MTMSRVAVMLAAIDDCHNASLFYQTRNFCDRDMTPFARISVIVPCFNAAPFISATLRSVLSQQSVELEVIVIDDGSTDGSADLVARSFPAVKLLRQENQGVAAARNFGLRHARHDWVAFVDADDVWLPGKLAAQCAILSLQGEARMSYTAWQVWTSDAPNPDAVWLADLRQRAGDTPRWIGATGWIYPELLLDCVVWTSTVLVQRSLMRELGGFDPELRLGEDYDLWLRASRVTQILRVPAPYALYRMHPSSLTKQPTHTNFKHVVVSRALSNWGYVGPDGRHAPALAVARSQAKTWSDRAGARLQSGDLARARIDAVLAVRACAAHWPAWKVLIKALVRSLFAGR